MQPLEKQDAPHVVTHDDEVLRDSAERLAVPGNDILGPSIDDVPIPHDEEHEER